jgi:hypothetical protein
MKYSFLLIGEKAFPVPCSRMARSLAVWFALCTVAACAGSGVSSGATQAAARSSDSTANAPRRSATLITEDEIAKSSARDAHHAVQLLRPDWLRPRGASSLNGAPADVMIYLNGQRFGGSESLRQFQASSIKEMRYISASEATNRYGTGHNSGAILVKTK